jgi:hypothetical protein
MSAAKKVAITAEQRDWLDSLIKAKVYGAPISDAAIEKILNSVGVDYVPRDLDRQQLKKEIRTRPATPLYPCKASSARKFAVNPGPSAESRAEPRRPRCSARSRTKSTVGADILP